MLGLAKRTGSPLVALLHAVERRYPVVFLFVGWVDLGFEGGGAFFSGNHYLPLSLQNGSFYSLIQGSDFALKRRIYNSSLNETKCKNINYVYYNLSFYLYFLRRKLLFTFNCHYSLHCLVWLKHKTKVTVQSFIYQLEVKNLNCIERKRKV